MSFLAQKQLCKYGIHNKDAIEPEKYRIDRWLYYKHQYMSCDEENLYLDDFGFVQILEVQLDNFGILVIHIKH